MDPGLAGFLSRLAEKLDSVERQLALQQTQPSPPPPYQRQAAGLQAPAAFPAPGAAAVSPTTVAARRRSFRSPPTGGGVGGGAGPVGGSDGAAAAAAAATDAARGPRGDSPPNGGSDGGALLSELRAVREALYTLPAHGAASVSGGGFGLSAAEEAGAEVLLRRELRRTSDAYAALVRESRAAKLAGEARERSLTAEVEKLRSAVRWQRGRGRGRTWAATSRAAPRASHTSRSFVSLSPTQPPTPHPPPTPTPLPSHRRHPWSAAQRRRRSSPRRRGRRGRPRRRRPRRLTACAGDRKSVV